MADQTDSGAPSHTEGLRAWIGEIDRAIRKRTRLGAALFAVLGCVAGAALFMAIQTSDNSASNGEVPGLSKARSTSLRDRADRSPPAQSPRGPGGAIGDRATAEVARAAKPKFRALRQSAAAPTSHLPLSRRRSPNSSAATKSQTDWCRKELKPKWNDRLNHQQLKAR